jgi:hypothetical protein
VQLHVLLTSDAQALAAANALARALPLYSRKSAPPAPRTLTATFSTPSGPLSAEAHASLEHFAGAVRTAARLVDTPTAELHTTALVAEVQAVAWSMACARCMVLGVQPQDRPRSLRCTTRQASPRRLARRTLHLWARVSSMIQEG